MQCITWTAVSVGLVYVTPLLKQHLERMKYGYDEYLFEVFFFIQYHTRVIHAVAVRGNINWTAIPDASLSHS